MRPHLTLAAALTALATLAGAAETVSERVPRAFTLFAEICIGSMPDFATAEAKLREKGMTEADPFGGIRVFRDESGVEVGLSLVTDNPSCIVRVHGPLDIRISEAFGDLVARNGGERKVFRCNSTGSCLWVAESEGSCMMLGTGIGPDGGFSATKVDGIIKLRPACATVVEVAE